VSRVTPGAKFESIIRLLPEKTKGHRLMMRTRFALALLLLTIAGIARAQTVVVDVDAASQRHPISPWIYGVAYASGAQLADLNAPVNRWGGNGTSTYNWQANASNHAADWYFESIAEDGNALASGAADDFISAAKTAGAEPLMTIPMIGWVAKLGPGRSKLASFSIAKYGPQTDRDWQWFSDAGNGISTSGKPITINDLNDANLPADALFQMGWVAHLQSKWGNAASGGVKLYLLDNEPSLWHETHRDVHPTGATMDEMRSKIIDYATRIKTADPAALIAAPEEWGWLGYLYSGYDQQLGPQNGWSSFPDHDSHGGIDFVPWMLGQLQAESATRGARLIDYLTVHYYPQGGEDGDDTSAAMQALRNRSTRSLWDPNYTDETWIAQKIDLMPRLKTWVASSYPGTMIGITEYSWGAESHINGATAQADVLGIFGREGADLATRWGTPNIGTPVYNAMKMYRNYDGAKSTFGETSVSTVAPQPDTLSAFGALRARDGALTVMLINKTTTAATTVSLANFNAAGPAQVWQLTSSNQIARLADAPVSSNQIALTLPGQSITLLVIEPSQRHGHPVRRR
jgi:Glycoside hydrolase family 44